MQNITRAIPIDTSVWADKSPSSTLTKIYIGGYKEFDLTVQLSASHGLVYNVYTSPIDEAAFFMSQTGATLTSGIHSANVHHFINNNMNWLLILGSASEVNSASLINLYITSLSEEKT